MIKIGSSRVTTLLLTALVFLAIWLVVPSPADVRRQINFAAGTVKPWYRVDQLSVDWNAATGEMVVLELRESLRPARGEWRSSVVRTPEPTAAPDTLEAGGVVCFGSGSADYAPEKGSWLILPLDEYVSAGCQARLRRGGTSYFVITEREFFDPATGETWSMPRAVSGPFEVPEVAEESTRDGD